MANVPISSSFINRVDNKIRDMRSAEIKALGERPKVNISPDSALADNLIWGEHLHLKNQMPDLWKQNIDYIYVRYESPTLKPDGMPYKHEFGLYSTGGEFTTPRTDEYRPRYKITREVSEPQIQAVMDWCDRESEIEQRWNSVREKVAQFFNSCKSLNEAVKLWPDCKVYVDKEDLERLERKVVRAGSKESEAAQVLATLNTDELMGAAVVARLSGAA